MFYFLLYFHYFTDMSSGLLELLESTSSWTLASDMSGKGCQLLVSPCNMSPSLGIIKGHQPQSIRISPPQWANPSPCSGMENVRKRVTHSFASVKQGRSQVVLPTLSLCRQVLTNGKHPNMPTRSPHQQAPAHHTPSAAVPTTVQTGQGSSHSGFKGKTLTMVKITPSMCTLSVYNSVLALQRSGSNPQLKTIIDN